MALNGCAVTIKVGTNDVDGINNISFDQSADMLDTTDFSSSCFREFIAGLKSGTVSISGDYEPGDTNGQIVLRDAFTSGAVLTGATAVSFTVDGTNGFAADSLVTSFSVNSTVEGKSTVSISLQLTGTISYSS